MGDLELIRERDPASLGWPPTFAIEIAMRTMPVEEVCNVYGISAAEWGRIKKNPIFIKELSGAIKALKDEGMGFKMRCQMQANDMLMESYRMVMSKDTDIPPSVKADLIKFTIRAAGYDGSLDKSGNTVSNGAFQININL
jgi:hypothetical protein